MENERPIFKLIKSVAEKIDSRLGLNDSQAHALIFLIKEYFGFRNIKLLIDPYNKEITIKVFWQEKKEILVKPKNQELLNKMAEYLGLPYTIKFSEKKDE